VAMSDWVSRAEAMAGTGMRIRQSDVSGFPAKRTPVRVTKTRQNRK
jgi:hypothetical protein